MSLKVNYRRQNKAFFVGRHLNTTGFKHLKTLTKEMSILAAARKMGMNGGTAWNYVKGHSKPVRA